MSSESDNELENGMEDDMDSELDDAEVSHARRRKTRQSICQS